MDIQWIGKYTAIDLSALLNVLQSNRSGGLEIGNYFFLNEEAAIESAACLLRQYRTVLPIARRCDADEILCVATDYDNLSKGSILLIHDGAVKGTEVTAIYYSMEEWLDHASDALETLYIEGN